MRVRHIERCNQRRDIEIKHGCSCVEVKKKNMVINLCGIKSDREQHWMIRQLKDLAHMLSSDNCSVFGLPYGTETRRAKLCMSLFHDD